MRLQGRRRATLLVILAAVAALSVANASVFAYRTLYGNVKIADITQGQDQTSITQYGLACVGFYTSDSIKDRGVLPTAGTNYNAAPIGTTSTGGWYGVNVVPGDVACSWTNTSTNNTNTLYKTATVYINVTNGDWYFKDILGFGYPNITSSPSPAYVIVRVEGALSNTNITEALLKIYDASSGNLIGQIDLKNNGDYINFTLTPGQGVQIDLDLSATGAVSLDNFTVRFYISPSSEQPR